MTSAELATFKAELQNLVKEWRKGEGYTGSNGMMEAYADGKDDGQGLCANALEKLLESKFGNESQPNPEVKYWIRKWSRPGAGPYQGPSCEAAGIEPGLHYVSREAALADAAKLAKVNGVGWVVEVINEESIDENPRIN
jgi:hypothetical protein